MSLIDNLGRPSKRDSNPWADSSADFADLMHPQSSPVTYHNRFHGRFRGLSEF